jgi:hypothetical protein
MAPSSRSLATLPEVALREILAHLLVDTPRTPTRAAILRTCSTLHQLGMPLLYRVVDLVGYPRSTFTEDQHKLTWDSLFGTWGLLTEHGRIKNLGRSVRVLRVGMFWNSLGEPASCTCAVNELYESFSLIALSSVPSAARV